MSKVNNLNLLALSIIAILCISSITLFPHTLLIDAVLIMVIVAIMLINIDKIALYNILLIIPIFNEINRINSLAKYQILLNNLILGIICFYISYFIFSKKIFFRTKFDLLILFFLLIIIGNLFNPNLPAFEIGWAGFKLIGTGCILYFVTRNLFSTNMQRIKFLYYLQISSLAVSLYGLYQKIFGLNQYDTGWIKNLNSVYVGGSTLRIFSTLDSPFALAMFLGVSILIGIKLLSLLSSTLEKGVTIVAIFLNSVVLILTMVRGAWVALIAGVLIQWFVGAKGKSIRNTIIVLGVLILAFGAIGVPSNLISRVSSLSNPFQDPAVQTRFQTWRHLIFTVSKYPFGMGLGTTGGVSELFSKQGLITYVASDNQYISSLYELGYPGIVVLAIIVVTSLIISFRGYRSSSDITNKNINIIFLACTIFYTVAFFTNNVLQLFPSSILFWIILGLQFNEVQETPNPVDKKHYNSC